jgi:hypothetical protein
MGIPSAYRRQAVGVAAVVLSALVAGPLLPHPAPAGTPAKSAVADSLRLIWVEGGDQLQIEGAGYRPKAIADIRLGSDPIQQVRADPMGLVRVRVPRRLVIAGQPGASVIVIGRSKFGMSRALISAVPPRAAGRGPVDALPWAVAVLLLAGIALWVSRRSRRGSAAAGRRAPRGYRPLHRA